MNKRTATELFERTMVQPFSSMGNSSILSAIRNSFVLSLPLIMAGSLAVLINNLPISIYQQFMLETFGDNWRNLGTYILFGTFEVMSLIMSFSVAYNISIKHNQIHVLNKTNPLIAAIVAFASLIAIMHQQGSFVGAYQWAGVSGLFVSMLVSIAATLIFLSLSKVKKLRVDYFVEDAVDISVPHSMSAIIPAILTIGLFASLRGFLSMMNIPDVFELFYTLMQKPFEGLVESLPHAMMYIFAIQLLWFFGIHGSNVLIALKRDVYTPAMEDNINAIAAGNLPEHIFTTPFFDVFVFMGGAGATICLLIALLFFTKRSRSLGKLSIAPALFNINEILVFGLPIVLNPFFLIPFILCPLVIGISSYLFTLAGILPYTIVNVEWTTPPLINAYVATGSIKGVIVQIFNLAIGTAIYLPFVLAYDRYKEDNFKKVYADLLDVSINGENQTSDLLLSREDDIGSAARVLGNELTQALRNNELFMEFQPKFDTETNRVYGAEALVRWKHPKYGMVPPPAMIAVAEDSDLIHELGYWVLEYATDRLMAWKSSGAVDQDFILSINVSVKQLSDTALPNKIAHMLQSKGLKPQDVEIEVTESIALTANAELNETLQKLHEQGLYIAVDDFGMGHSSLLYLQKYPVDVLKIDASLSRNVLTDQNVSKIIKAIEEVCRSLDVEMVVEYVETKEQLAALQALGAARFQGYYFSKPLAADRMVEYVEKTNG